MFERKFNLAPYDAVTAENNLLLTMVSAEMTLPHINFSGTKIWNDSFYCLSRGSYKYDVSFNQNNCVIGLNQLSKRC